MKFNLKKEIITMIIAVLPLAYLLIIWNSLPESVPIHWNVNGEIDRMGNKNTLFLIPFLLPILTYLIFILVPFIDPKGKLQNMGNKLNRLKFILTLFMSLLAMYILYTTKAGTLTNPNIITILIGILFILLGNYFKTIKPNYFIGIRTPWALNDDNNWKLTHKLSSVLWIIGGLVIVISGFLVSNQLNMTLFSIIIAILVIVPFIYSYKIYSEKKKTV